VSRAVAKIWVALSLLVGCGGAPLDAVDSVGLAGDTGGEQSPEADTAPTDASDDTDRREQQVDGDLDGWPSAVDCDDSDPAVYPRADEVCDGVDNDCDGRVDDEDSDLVDGEWYMDRDGDGYGNPSSFVCELPKDSEGEWVQDNTDTNDYNAYSYPGSDEVDDDGDGYAEADGDCNDLPGMRGAEMSPAHTEICDTLDNDCDGFSDDADDSLEADIWYLDVDGDGYGDPDHASPVCITYGYSSDNTDSDDSNEYVYPGAPERCDGIQNDSDATGWTLAEEDGMEGTALFVAPDGVESDWTDRVRGDVTLTDPGELWICTGTWEVNLTVTTDELTIIGSGPDATTLDGGGADVVIHADNVAKFRVEELTITNGRSSHGGGMRLYILRAEVENVILTQNSADYGSAAR